MEVTTCQHTERVEARNGIEVGECTECHQTIQYDEDHKNPTVTKLGRLGDKLVLPNTAYKLLLDPRDQQDLASVSKAAKDGVPLGAVPPKPQTGGMHAVKRYYDEHKDAILHDLDTLGEKAMRKRWWNMSQVTFLGLMARWRPEYPGIPRWALEKGKRVKGTSARIKTARPRLKKRRNLDKYLQEHKETIIQDYQTLPLKEFFAKWHIFSKRWTQLKKEWEVPPKVPSRARPRMKREAAPSLAYSNGHDYADLVDVLQRQLHFPPNLAKEATKHAFDTAKDQPLEDKLKVALQYLDTKGTIARTQRLTQPPSNAKSLPEFPPFSDKWQPSVQEKWFETYLELRKIGKAADEESEKASEYFREHGSNY